ncbi:hypothetical protein [Sphingosinithalassobacter portus]|uniref:hypothetical protein n=1 Tax=Stakelama portus TaxID=2676234 RepID=UPI000D6EA371|nr:hypothetical protein [Sphingosinithalassobacter portus]
MRNHHRTALAAALLLIAGTAATADAAPARSEIPRSGEPASTDAPLSRVAPQEPAIATWISLAMLAAAGFALWRTMRRDRRNAARTGGPDEDPLTDTSFEARLARRLDELNADAEPIRPPPGSFGRRRP